MKELLYIAHRGHKTYAPENTIEAAWYALENGATGLEIDLRICGSGEIVLFHDKTLLRHFSKSRILTHTSFEKLKSFSFNNHPYKADDKVTALTDFLEEFKGTVPVNLDVKTLGSNNRDLINGLLKAVDDLNMQDQVWISAFNPVFMRQIKTARPALRTGFLFRNLSFIIRQIDILLDSDAWHPHHSLINDTFIKKARSKNKEIYTWTVNDPAKLEILKKYEIEGIITDKLFLGSKTRRS